VIAGDVVTLTKMPKALGDAISALKAKRTGRDGEKRSCTECEMVKLWMEDFPALDLKSRELAVAIGSMLKAGLDAAPDKAKVKTAPTFIDASCSSSFAMQHESVLTQSCVRVGNMYKNAHSMVSS
jgi:hypothetical protein